MAEDRPARRRLSRWVAVAAAVVDRKVAVRSQLCLAAVAVVQPVAQPAHREGAGKALMATLTPTIIPTADLRRLPRRT